MSDQSVEIGAITVALSKAQAAFKPILRTKTVKVPNKFSYNYADLASILESVLPILSAQGLAVVQTTDTAPDGVVVVTTLCHSSGQWIRGRLGVKCGTGDAKAIGSAITYARRYALSAIIGVASEEDDDGVASNPRGEARESREERPARRQQSEGRRPLNWREIRADTRIDDSPAFAFLGTGLRGRRIGDAAEDIVKAGIAAHFDEISREEAKIAAEDLKGQLAVYHGARRLTLAAAKLEGDAA